MARNPDISLPDISLTVHEQKFIAALVDSGRYRGTSEVLRAALKLLEEREERRQTAVQDLEAAVAEGLASGDPVPLESMDDIIAEAERGEMQG